MSELPSNYTYNQHQDQHHKWIRDTIRITPGVKPFLPLVALYRLFQPFQS
jgi:hypothetical protein